MARSATIPILRILGVCLSHFRTFLVATFKKKTTDCLTSHHCQCRENHLLPSCVRCPAWQTSDVGAKMKTALPLLLLIAICSPCLAGSEATSRSAANPEKEVASTPGFETTKICGRDVLRLATERAQKEKIDFTQFRSPVITLTQKKGRMTWIVIWYLKEAVAGGFFTVHVDDETGAAELVGGM